MEIRTVYTKLRQRSQQNWRLQEAERSWKANGEAGKLVKVEDNPGEQHGTLWRLYGECDVEPGPSIWSSIIRYVAPATSRRRVAAP
ncbi:uncharacterized protein MYCGRDRAFT_79452 [Zymoseptoria tritici IPO323]|uniref:Uncharacterized protein n=1 Tax=Zymoseptoria tritici (strain CBS 115943 / IPO323) TaxID=336722 RepID=F9X3Q2_ZYMTI|nr:uncharacterized protein MYCGRDRAFT_79452 [Zymoseptoria tritici IPO323]EGP89938.1 hypothetical protein MYCGRDRAFT_79452 [Zymoseptoria tritici IPO323]